MRASTDARFRFITAALVACAIGALPARAAAQCVGDCAGDGEVSISDLITGVNIALGSQPVSACQAFANGAGEVTIAQLIQGVNNALNGCPPPLDTPTATATDRPPATATHTFPLPSATSTATLQPSATSTATAPPTATATGIPTGTATATATATAALPTATATATTPPTNTATASPPPTNTATASAPPTATATATLPTATASATSTATAVNTATASATSPPTATPSATSPPTATPSATSPPTATNTPAATATATATFVPPGESAAGRAAIVSTGLGSVQNVVGAIVTILTNDGAGATLTYGLGDPEGGAAAVDDCPISGTTSQECVALPSTALTFTLGAANCISAGPAGGEAEFNGGITINAAPFFLNNCVDPLFLSGTYAVDELNVRYRNALSEPLLNVSADLTGTFSIAGTDASCLVGGLNLSLNGTLFSTLADGAGVIVEFMNTQVVMDQITYNSDCVPLAYRLTFNGPATFTPTHTALVEAWSPLIAGGLSDEVFTVTFATFRITQNATADPVIVSMSGNMTSDCFGGTIGLSTFTPVAVAGGQLCPDAGVLDVTGGGTTARVTYADGGVTVAPAVGAPEVYPSCLDPALLMCPA